MSPEKLPVEKNIMGNTEKKIKVLVKPQCDAEIRDRFITKFGEKCEFVFEENETRDSITTAEVVIGEPEESELQKAGNFRWVQLTCQMRAQRPTVWPQTMVALAPMDAPSLMRVL